jgi:hypothetical protein
MRAKVTTHVLLGRKSLGCPARYRSGRNDLGGEQTVRLEHNEIAAASKTSPRKIVFAERSGKPIQSSLWRRPKTLRKNQANALSGTAGVWAQASQDRFAE